MNEENQTPDQAIQPSDAVNMDQVCKRFKENITVRTCHALCCVPFESEVLLADIPLWCPHPST